MSHARSRSRIAALAIGATLAVPFLVSSLQASPQALPAPPPAGPASAATFGYGKGWLEIPVVCQDGRMSGVLSNIDGRELFQLEAQLTGCMPGATLGWPDSYWFGGLYGRIGKLRETNPDLGAEFGLYTVEGTWVLDEPTFGSFSAIVIKEIASGRRFVVGKLYGEFSVGASSNQGATLSWGDASRPGKPAKSPFDEAGAHPARKLGDARSQWAKDAWGDVASVPRKDGGKSAYDDAWRKVASDPWGDVVSVPRKGDGKTPFDEAGAYPADKLGDARSAPRKGGKSAYDDAWRKVASDPWGDVVSKPRKDDFKTPFDEAGANPADKLGDARSAPRKGGKSAYDDAWRKVASDPWGDVVSVPRKGGKTPVDDAASQPPGHLAGTFLLRFVILD